MPLLHALSRIPSGDKLVDSRGLNRLGVQVVRAIAARLVYHLRRVPVDPAVRGHVGDLARDGVIVVPGFLAPDEFDAVRDECTRLEADRASLRITQYGPNTQWTRSIKSLDAAVWPAIHRFCADARLVAMFRAAERRPLPPLSEDGVIEYLVQGLEGGRVDPQTELHTDIFFNSHKAWLYLDDVGQDDGPFAFVRGSHRLTAARLAKTYEHSWRRAPDADQSRRIPPEELAGSGDAETAITCAANTLVVANTCGYHRRRQGRPGRKRRSLFLTLRANPFRPRDPRQPA